MSTLLEFTASVSVVLMEKLFPRRRIGDITDVGGDLVGADPGTINVISDMKRCNGRLSNSEKVDNSHGK